MAWNEPGGSKDKDPWGNRGNDQGPPDLDEVVRKMQDKLGGILGGKKGKGGGGDGPSGGSIKGTGFLALIALVVWLAYDMLYIIQPAERGVVLRFGRYTDTMQPGLNIRLPRPIESVLKVDVERNRNVLIGYRSGSEGRSTRSTAVPSEALMLTRDENIVDVRFAIQYNIKSARDYLFNVKNPDLSLSEATESAIREAVGKSDMDFVLKEGRSNIVDSVKSLVQEILDSYGTGLMVISVNMQDAQPPEQVQHAFDDAVKAREDQQRLINEAEAYSNDILPKARGAAARKIEEGSAYKEQVVSKAEGEAERFERILAEYKKAPDVTRQRLYLEAIEDVLGNTSKVMIDIKGGNNLLYLPLDRLGVEGAAPAAPTQMPDINTSSFEAQTSAAVQQLIKREGSSIRGRERR